MTTIAIDRAVVEEALEALETLVPTKGPSIYNSARDALRAALAQQAEPLNLSDRAVQRRLAAQWGYVHEAQQAEPVEPVAGVVLNEEGRAALVEHGREEWHCVSRNARRLYTAPPQRPTEPVQGPEGMVEFLADLQRSRTKYPKNRRMFDGLMGEIDELRRAYAGDGDIRAEAFDVAVCAFRIATEGDAGGNARLEQAEPVEPVDVGLLEYRGNSVAFIHQKMTAYRAGIDAAWDAFRAKGLHPDGKTPLANMIAKYTAPPQRQPLTEEEIKDCFHAARNAKLGASKDNSKHRLSVVEIARAVERAHGIGETK